MKPQVDTPPRFNFPQGHPFEHASRGPVLLVHGQCSCGWVCACPEGWLWPKCPVCGEQVLPPRPDEDCQRRGYVAFQMPELEAVAHISHGATLGPPPRRGADAMKQIWSRWRRKTPDPRTCVQPLCHQDDDGRWALMLNPRDVSQIIMPRGVLTGEQIDELCRAENDRRRGVNQSKWARTLGPVTITIR